MYVSIDCDKMRFLHKHADFKVMADLEFIEAPSPTHVDTLPTDYVNFIKGHTLTEMQLLYKNTTGEERSPYMGEQLRAVLIELANRLPESDVVPEEVHRQADWIQKSHPNGAPGFFYVKGASIPARTTQTLFKSPLLAHLTPSEAKVAACKPLPLPQYPGVSPHVPTPHPTHSEPVARAVRAPSAAPTGGVRQLIWSTADKMWEEDGKPSVKPAVLSVRKRVMDFLEKTHQIKRTSSSNELGNWQKARI